MASIDVKGVSSEYINGAELEQAGVSITGPRAELEGILREQGATPVERLLSLTDAGEGELPTPSAADPAPGPKGPTLAAVDAAVKSIGKAQEWLVGALGEITGGGLDLDECQNWLRETGLYVQEAERSIRYARDIRGGREPGDDAHEPPDPKREALEKRARAYEASGRLQQVAYGARSVPGQASADDDRRERRRASQAVVGAHDALKGALILKPLTDGDGNPRRDNIATARELMADLGAALDAWERLAS